jgi:hypothetical protein
MGIELTIAEVERIFSAPDTRPLSRSILAAANRRHDEMLALSPWFRLWPGILPKAISGFL